MPTLELEQNRKQKAEGRKKKKESREKRRKLTAFSILLSDSVVIHGNLIIISCHSERSEESQVINFRKAPRNFTKVLQK